MFALPTPPIFVKIDDFGTFSLKEDNYNNSSKPPSNATAIHADMKGEVQIQPTTVLQSWIIISTEKRKANDNSR